MCRLLRPSQKRLYTRHELFLTEGLAEVVVCALRQPLYLFVLFSQRGEHDDWHVRNAPQLLKRLEAIEARQHHVQDHQIRQPVAHRFERFFA